MTRKNEECTWVISGLTSVLFSVILGACSTHYTTMSGEDAPSGHIYQLSESEALQIAHAAIVELFPGRNVMTIDGPTRGFWTSFRFALDTYSQQVLAVPATGVAADGREIRGYRFDVSGSGSSLILGRRKNAQLFQRVSALAEQTGSAVPVSQMRAGRAAPRTAAPVADAAASASSMRPDDPAQRLRSLKSLHDEGLLSDDEYQRKRRVILDAM